MRKTTTSSTSIGLCGRGERRQAAGDEAHACPRPWPRRRHLARRCAGSPSSCASAEEKESVMGQKVNPIGLRLGINRTWDSRWYPRTEYKSILPEDFSIRESLRSGWHRPASARIVIERPTKRPRITIHTARPGVVIGKKGQDIEKLRKRSAGSGGEVSSQHRRGAQARDRRPARGREHRPAARAPHRLPPRHEARRAVGDASGRPGHPDQCAAASAGPRSRASSGIARVVCRCIRCVPTSTSVAPQPSRPTAPAASRFGFQGRGHGARPDGQDNRAMSAPHARSRSSR